MQRRQSSGLPNLRFPLLRWLKQARNSASRKTSAPLLMITALCAISVAQVQTYRCTQGFTPVGVAPVAPILPATLMQSLKTVPNPVIPNGPTGVVRADLADFIANQPASIQLGKALFWEMQAGSDSKTACATCHFKAGIDGRGTNQMNPGANGGWDGFGYGPNYTLASIDFPLTSLPAKDVDNIIGSQGVRMSQFLGFSKSGGEQTSSLADPIFSVGGVNVRQVTGKNTPSAINAVFNHRNFWNGRAQAEFNGNNPFGNRDASARVWVLGSTGSPILIDIHIQNASLASQAVGPPLSSVEMSAVGRTFPDLGHKLLLTKPLAQQKVDPTDSVLGSLADVSTGKGLTTNYTALIQKAFQSKWWNSKKGVTVNGKSYSMMEANFALFWGISVMLYEATLVADSSPMDQYLGTRVFNAGIVDPFTGMPALVSDNPALLDAAVNRLAADGISVTRADILNGLGLFERPVAPPPSYPIPSGFGAGCMGCHVGSETTSASVRNLTGPGVEAADAALKAAGFDLRMERMFLKADWTPPGPLTPVPLGTDAITFDPNTYAVNVISEIIPYPNGISTPISPAIPLPIATYDAGWYNLGVRPTADDIGLGGLDPFGTPLSWTQLFQTTAPGVVKVPGNSLGCPGAGNATFPNILLNPLGFPLLSGPLLSGEASDVGGTFKVPGLRDVEFTGPYFHNGGKSTLAQVVDFYDNGGDFDRTTNATKAPAIVPLQLDAAKQKSLVAFLLSLTDDRVRLQQAPFDHPQLFVPNGDNPIGTDNTIEIPAVGAAGSLTPLQRFLSLNPFAL
ncbi:MAG TPA: cytochrome c peroxidase [Candidatus Angelobacter sp.]|nr:cytochrome c peroxidase [Candidatus Angelobacter sp.]